MQEHLYKNKKPLFSYSGHYGNLLDIEIKTAQFILQAPAPMALLFINIKMEKYYEVVSSDTVVQAKKINNKEFIACEITPLRSMNIKLFQ